jgi:Bacteriophage Lambda NinG protein
MPNSRAVPKAKLKVVKKKVVPIPRLKKKLWSLFSLFIRLRDADANGNIRCCTMGNIYPWNKSQAGHYHSQRGNPALIFCEENVHAQSPIANKLQKNNITWEYTEFMIQRYGLDKLRQMAKLRGKEFKFTRQWLEEKIEYYDLQVRSLKLLKNL